MSGSDWGMFAVSDSHGKCKEFNIPVAIHRTTVDMKLDTGASVTFVLTNFLKACGAHRCEATRLFWSGLSCIS